jgi:hypothetical protein
MQLIPTPTATNTNTNANTNTNTQVPQPATLNAIIRAFAQNEAAFMADATAAGFAEPLEEVTERMLDQQQSLEFEDFFVWLSRRAENLVAPCHWLVFGPQMGLGRETEVPTFEQLQFLIQLVREHRPAWLPFTRRLITESVLAKVAGSQIIAPQVIAPQARLHSDASSSCVVVAP